MNKVRRSFVCYVLDFWAVAAPAYFSFTDSLMRYFFLAAALLLIIKLFGNVLRPFYFEVSDTTLRINRPLFRTETIELSDIERLDLQDGLFAGSYIHLKNGKPAVNFDYYLINDKDLRNMVDAYQIQMS